MNQYDVYLADLNPTIGREQQGKRPVLIISNNYENLLDVVTILAIISLKKIDGSTLPTPHVSACKRLKIQTSFSIKVA